MVEKKEAQKEQKKETKQKNVAKCYQEAIKMSLLIPNTSIQRVRKLIKEKPYKQKRKFKYAIQFNAYHNCDFELLRYLIWIEANATIEQINLELKKCQQQQNDKKEGELAENFSMQNRLLQDKNYK